MGTVTVVIVNWNGGTLLDKCLVHLTQQSLLPARILVMDNGSTGGSAERARQVPRVTVRMLGANLGFAGANNRALDECDTDLVALLNPDAFPAADWLMNLVSTARAHPNVAVFGSRQMVHEAPTKLDGIGDIYHISGLVWRDGHSRVKCAGDDIACEIFSPCACAVLYRRDALVRTGGFDEDYFCYVEDIDLGFRLRLAGHTSIYVPNAVVHHVGAASSGGRHSDFSVYHGHRNLVWTFIKNMPGVLFWALLPLHILLNFVTIVHFSTRGQGKVIWRAKRDAIKGIPRMWHKRRRIQANRRATIVDIWRALDKRPF
ncbi:glycosyltransferase family 2 protein [Nitrosovibrio sp. Nv6]|uniref:glycosyltransferase family 2 protein n=1 Tax=Nitrosovibrio sp. Nv6 TaxID=1855340 RepID=UPI0008C29E3A|nr:glycosyltransferase family 2 protein [Nitrosovibrio sp. Nv6]SEP23985.1 Glycosyltransferase, GT2 family [Nitrosovibrio sp. Nv6]